MTQHFTISLNDFLNSFLLNDEGEIKREFWNEWNEKELKNAEEIAEMNEWTSWIEELDEDFTLSIDREGKRWEMREEHLDETPFLFGNFTNEDLSFTNELSQFEGDEEWKNDSWRMN